MSATITTRLLDVIPIPLGPLKMDAFGHLWLVKGFHPLLISALKNYQYVPQWVKITSKGLIFNFKLTKKWLLAALVDLEKMRHFWLIFTHSVLCIFLIGICL